MTAIPKPTRERNESYLSFIGKQPCLVLQVAQEAICTGPIDAHHIRKGEHSGIATKPSDFTAVPLCRGHHQRYHDWGYTEFVSTYGVDIPSEQRRLQLLYKATLPKIPRGTKKPRLKVGLQVKHCPCGQEHFYPLSKVNFHEKTVGFFCKVRNAWMEAEA